MLQSMHNVWTLIKVISIPYEEQFSKRPSGAPLHTLPKSYDVPCWFCEPRPLIWGFVLLYSGHRRVAVTRYRMICHVLGGRGVCELDASPDFDLKNKGSRKQNRFSEKKLQPVNAHITRINWNAYGHFDILEPLDKDGIRFENRPVIRQGWTLHLQAWLQSII